MLETRIEELTKAVRDLIDVLVVSGRINTAEKVPDEPKVEVPNVPQNSAPAIDTSPPSLPEFAPVTYDDVKRITIEVSKKSKDKAVAALARFGVKTARELTETRWSEYVEYMTKVASGEVDPEASE